MKERKDSILLFAGTTEGRNLAEALRQTPLLVWVCVATDYGRELEPEGENIHVRAGRMDAEEMARFAREKEISLVLDATHPFAREATGQIRQMAEACGLEYWRVLRGGRTAKPEEAPGEEVRVESVKEAVAYLKHTEGNILITTGGKELKTYQELPDWKNRCYARVLSTPEAVEGAAALGFQGAHLLAMQGPFTEELNRALLGQVRAAWMVTKDSGSPGGLEEKLEAARKAGVRTVVIGRPKESGLEMEETLRRLQKRYGFIIPREIVLAGTGPGSHRLWTREVREAVEGADVLIGARRMLEQAGASGNSAGPGAKPCFAEYRAEEIRKYIEDHPEFRRITVLLSGDTGFYSGARNLARVLGKERVRILPGISSVSCLAAKLGEPLEGAGLGSLHGKQENVTALVREYGRVFLLAGAAADIPEVCRRLTEGGLGHTRVTAGCHLTEPEERILEGRAETFCEQYCREMPDGLAVLFLHWQEWESPRVTPGLPDDRFVRGKVPMTKSEVRSVILSRLALRRHTRLWDIGAGTGSVALEAALLGSGGHVWAVEENPEGTALIRENQNRLGVENLTVVEGKAPEALEELPEPDAVFIGGSGGRLEEILETVRRKNPKVRVVLSAITLNTLSACLRYGEAHPELKLETVQIQTARSRKAGACQLMQGMNPVWIVTLEPEQE